MELGQHKAGLRGGVGGVRELLRGLVGDDSARRALRVHVAECVSPVIGIA